MSATTPYDDEFKFRLPSDWKKRLQDIADHEGLDLSDIARRAIREFLGKDAACNSPRNRRRTTPS